MFTFKDRVEIHTSVQYHPQSPAINESSELFKETF